MSDKKNEPASLLLCNLASRHGLAKAREIMAENAKTEASAPATKPKKQTTADKKAVIAEQLKDLNADLPAESDSLAKWDQALTAAKSAGDGTDDLM